MQCANYAVQRQEMVTQLILEMPNFQNLLNNVRYLKHRKELVKTLIQGTGNEILDTKIFKIVATYIEDTRRFER